MKVIDLAGKKFNKLTILKRAENTKSGNARWICRCDCGVTTIVSSAEIRNGHTKSCGCLRIEVSKNLRKTHGQTGTRLYRIWRGMKNRCYNPNEPAFNRYGAYGITVCQEWMAFEPFRDWAFENGYNSSLTNDRIDNDGPYSPDNCHWTTPKGQARNRRNNKHFYARSPIGRWYGGRVRIDFEKYGLHKSAITRCIQKKTPQHKGWTFFEKR